MKQKGLRIFGAIIIAIYALCSISNLIAGGASWGFHLATVLELGAVILALFYMFKGFKKDAAKYFHWFAISFMILQCGVVLFMANTGKSTPCLFFALLAFAFSVLLAFAENLGKKKSHAYIGIIFVINVIALVMTIVSHGIQDGTMVGIGSMIPLSLVYYACIHGKYLDKDARGTK